MKLVARFVLLACGGPYLAAVLAGRRASHAGADAAAIVAAEIVGGLAGLAVALVAVGLARAWRPPATRVLADLISCALGGLWLVVMIGEVTGWGGDRIWPIAAWVWSGLGLAAVVTWLAARRRRQGRE